MGTFVYHITTKNKSFLQTAKELKRRGVKNNKFFLKLYDKDLLDVKDPLKARSSKMRSKILAEIKRNPWYYYREIIRIEVPGGVTQFRLHIGSLALLYCMHNNINAFLELPRQQGKTIGAACGFSYMINFGTKSSDIIFGNKSGNDAEKNLKRTLSIIRHLPDWLAFLTPGGDIDNVRQFSSCTTKNTITTVSAPKDPIQADKIGRGLTTPMQWSDEFAFLSHNDIVYEAAGPALSQAKIEAKRFNKPYFRLITTTPNNRDIPEGAYAYEMKEDAVKFDETVYDMTYDDLHIWIRKNSQNDFTYIKYTWEELGRDKEWYDEQCRSLNNKRLKIKREVDLVWPLSTDSSYYQEEQLEILKNYETKMFTSNMRILNRYPLEIAEDVNFDPNMCYVLGIDVAAGVSRDASAITVINPFTEEPVAYFENNRIDTEDFKKVIVFLMVVMLPNSIAVIERNSVGINVNQALSKAISPVHNRIFFSYREGNATKVVRVRGKQPDNLNVTKVYGVDTLEKSRMLMHENLLMIVTNSPEKIRIPRIIEQISTLEEKKSGKIEHSASAKDDVLMSYLVGLYAIRDKKHFSPFLARYSKTRKSSKSSLMTIAGDFNAEAEAMPRNAGNNGMSARKTMSLNDYVSSSGQEERHKTNRSFNNIVNLN